MQTIMQILQELDDPRKYQRGHIFDFRIGFINPETNDEDETDVEIDTYSTIDFRKDVAGFWADFCTENGWKESCVELTDVWATSIQPLVDLPSMSLALPIRRGRRK